MHNSVRRFVYRVAGGDVMSWFDCASFETPDAMVCLDCGAWGPLGPANDEPEAVRQEIAAATIAADWDLFNDDWRGCVSMGSLDPEGRYLDICIPERDAGRPGRARDVFELEIGMLAAEIATHKDDDHDAR